MKSIIYLLLFTLLFIGCDNDNPIDSNDVETKVEEYKSHNVKENGKHYFSFSTNTAETSEHASYDIAFGTVPLTVETAPCQYFTMPNDPLILCAPNSFIAEVDAISLEDVTEIPDESEFQQDDSIGEAFIGKSWFDQSYQVKNEVYVIETCAGNYALLDIEKYDIDMTSQQITSISWKLKINNNGSLDFTSTNIDSFSSQNAYDETRYFSFENGSVSSTDNYQLKIEGSSFWLGPDVSVKKLTDTGIEEVTTVANSDFQTDVKPNYLTLGWYNYGDGHLLTAKDYVYVVKTTDSKHAAFEITNYYDDQGNSGSFTIEWKYLD